MAIELADRVRRAIELARGLGRTAASPTIAATAGSTSFADPAEAEVVVVLADEVDPVGAARIDAPVAARRLVAVLSDDGVLRESVDAPNARGVEVVVFRRGVAWVEDGRFVLREVEDDVSAKETALELSVPLFTDERLVAFPV